MNKKISILFIIVSFIIFANLALLKSNAFTKIHNNHLFFTGMRSVSFTVERHCISPKQPYATPDGNQAGFIKHGKRVGINIRAGRHGSKETVNCTSANLIDKSASFKDNFTFGLPLIGNRTPKKLNFAVKGTLVIHGKYFDDIILAQGSVGSRNNWWFGGNECKKIRNFVGTSENDENGVKEQVECTARDGIQWCFLRGSTGKYTENSPDHVNVKMRRCPT